MRAFGPVSLASLVLLVALSGCVSFDRDGAGQGVGGPGVMAYRGAQPGVDRGDPFPCAGSARVDANSGTSRGDTRVVVTDADGATVFDRHGAPAGADAHELDAEQDVTGAPGDWTITVHRLTGTYNGAPTGWVGQYIVSVECE